VDGITASSSSLACVCVCALGKYINDLPRAENDLDLSGKLNVAKLKSHTFVSMKQLKMYASTLDVDRFGYFSRSCWCFWWQSSRLSVFLKNNNLYVPKLLLMNLLYVSFQKNCVSAPYLQGA